MEHPWPLMGLRLRTDDLELRVPSDSDLLEVAALAGSDEHPIHEPGAMPFSVPWSLAPGPERARSTMQWHWRSRGEWQPEGWTLALVAVRAGVVVGTQDVRAAGFAASREVLTGSWVGGAHQRRGVATAMRRAVLHLCFEGLGASSARSESFADNPAGIKVSTRLGYRPDGTVAQERQGERIETLRFLLTREAWLAARRSWPAVEIVGLDPCLPMFGLR